MPRRKYTKRNSKTLNERGPKFSSTATEQRRLLSNASAAPSVDNRGISNASIVQAANIERTLDVHALLSEETPHDGSPARAESNFDVNVTREAGRKIKRTKRNDKTPKKNDRATYTLQDRSSNAPIDEDIAFDVHELFKAEEEPHAEIPAPVETNIVKVTGLDREENVTSTYSREAAHKISRMRMFAMPPSSPRQRNTVARLRRATLFDRTNAPGDTPTPWLDAAEAAAHGDWTLELSDDDIDGTDDGFSDPESEIDEIMYQSEANDAYKTVCADNPVRLVPLSRIIASLKNNGDDTLDLRAAQLNDRDMFPIAAAVASHSTLAALDFSRNGISARGVGALIAGLREGTCRSLTNVDLSCNGKIGDRAVTELAQVLADTCARLRRLSLCYCDVRDCGASAVGSCFRPHSDLQILNLSGNRIGSKGAQALVPLLHAAGSTGHKGRGTRDGGLLSLHLGWNQIKDIGACAEAGIGLPTSALLHLDLSYNALGDVAGVTLAKNLGAQTTWSKLRMLDASRNHFGAKAATAFANALTVANTLQVLKLGWNPLGTPGAIAIVRAISLGPTRGRYLVPHALHTVQLENTTRPGDEYKLIELATAYAEYVTRLAMPCIKIVVEFPDRTRRQIGDLMTVIRGPHKAWSSTQTNRGPTVPHAPRKFATKSVRSFARMTELRIRPQTTQQPVQCHNDDGDKRELSQGGFRPLQLPELDFKFGDDAGEALSKGFFPGPADRRNAAPNSHMKRDDSSKGAPVNIAKLATWSRRRSESSYHNSDAIQRYFARDWESFLSRKAVKEELLLQGVVSNLADFSRTPAQTHTAFQQQRSDSSLRSKRGPTLRTPKKLQVKSELEELEHELRRQYPILHRVFRHFASIFTLKHHNPTKISRMAFLAIFDALGLVDRRRLCANVAAMDWAFNAARTKAQSSQVRDDDDVIDDVRGLNCAEFLAALVLYISRLLRNTNDASNGREGNVDDPAGLNSSSRRSSECSAASSSSSAKSGIDGNVLTVSIRKLIDSALLRLVKYQPRSLLDPDVFRRRVIYTHEVDNALEPHSKPLGEIYSHYAQEDGDSNTDLLSSTGWLRMLHVASLIQGDWRPSRGSEHEDSDLAELPHLKAHEFDGDFTNADARCCFTWGQLLKRDDAQERREKVGGMLTRLDFLDAICWLSLFKPLPSWRAIRAPWNRQTLFYLFDIADEPALLCRREFASYVDVPVPPPTSPIDITPTELAGRVLKLLVVLYRGIARANDELTSICETVGETTAIQQLSDLANDTSDSDTDTRRNPVTLEGRKQPCLDLLGQPKTGSNIARP